MKISVWDTYVSRTDGKMMHFDILVPSEMTDKELIFDYGRQYLETKNYSTNGLSAKECRFCHMEQATPEIEDQIKEKGFYILEMENCH